MYNEENTIVKPGAKCKSTWLFDKECGGTLVLMRKHCIGFNDHELVCDKCGAVYLE